MTQKRQVETVLARGHRNILATHKTTLEFTKEDYLSKKGNCIIAVAANKGINDFSSAFRKDLQKNRARLAITIEAGGIKETLNASGNLRLILSHQTDMVVRKSSHICDRTLAIKASKSAYDLSRELVEKLKNSEQAVKITLAVEN